MGYVCIITMQRLSSVYQISIYITMNMNVIDLCSVKFQIKVHLVRVLIGEMHYGKYIGTTISLR